jgi:GntR family transcriptional regulator of vanillate catabolism
LLQSGAAVKLTSAYGELQLDDKAAAVAFKTHLATAWAQLGKPEKAESALKDALNLDPDNPEVRLLQARMAAERGCSTVVLNDARACLDRIDQLLAQDSLNDEAFSAYVAENEQFHALLAEMTDSEVVRRELERVIGLPFASPSGFVIAQANSPQARDMLIIAQDQHRQVLSAIENREGSRAEAIMREHSRLAQRNLSQAMRSPELQGMSTVRLIRRKR